MIAKDDESIHISCDDLVVFSAHVCLSMQMVLIKK